jgi:hypothetical protein
MEGEMRGERAAASSAGPDEDIAPIRPGVLGPASRVERGAAVALAGGLAGVMLAYALPEVARQLSLRLFTWADFGMLVGGTFGAAALTAAWRHGFRGLAESQAARVAVIGFVAALVTGLWNGVPPDGGRRSLYLMLAFVAYRVLAGPVPSGGEAGEEST